eukprot:5033347-Alexandrium_andersonii.AAC.1
MAGAQVRGLCTDIVLDHRRHARLDTASSTEQLLAWVRDITANRIVSPWVALFCSLEGIAAFR